MLPQFGYIVAQAGADYYSSLPTSPTLSMTNSNGNTNSNHHSALAPLLNKPTSNVILPPPSSFLSKQENIWYPPPSPPKYLLHEPQEPDHHSWQDKQEYNDLMTWMDNEFWEQTDELYKEKLNKLENELLSLQSGTHSVFEDMISDSKLKRDKVIQEAEIFMKYQISFIENVYNESMTAVEDEYRIQKKNMEDSLIQDKKRQMKEEKEDDQEEHRSRRNLRKRNAETGNTLKSEPLAKKRSVRTSQPPNIHATPTSLEEEELEIEFLNIKKLAAASQNSNTYRNIL